MRRSSGGAEIQIEIKRVRSIKKKGKISLKCPFISLSVFFLKLNLQLMQRIMCLI